MNKVHKDFDCISCENVFLEITYMHGELNSISDKFFENLL